MPFAIGCSLEQKGGLLSPISRTFGRCILRWEVMEVKTRTWPGKSMSSKTIVSKRPWNSPQLTGWIRIQKWQTVSIITENLVSVYVLIVCIRMGQRRLHATTHNSMYIYYSQLHTDESSRYWSYYYRLYLAAESNHTVHYLWPFFAAIIIFRCRRRAYQGTWLVRAITPLDILYTHARRHHVHREALAL